MVFSLTPWNSRILWKFYCVCNYTERILNSLLGLHGRPARERLNWTCILSSVNSLDSLESIGQVLRAQSQNSFVFFLIAVQLLYSVVLVSAVQYRESAICIHVLPPTFPFHSPRSSESI